MTQDKVNVMQALRDECAAEWDHLLNRTFSTPMAVEHLAQFVLRHREQAEAESKAREAELVEALQGFTEWAGCRWCNEDVSESNLNDVWQKARAVLTRTEGTAP